MKKLISIIAISLLTFVIVGCSSGKDNSTDAENNTNNENNTDIESNASAEDNGNSSDEKFVLKIGHTQVDDSMRNKGSEKMKEYIEEHSNGQIEVQIYPNGQLGSSKEQIESVQSGAVEMVIFPTMSLVDFQPIYALTDIPFLMPTEQDKVTELYKTDAFKEFMATGEDVGIKPLAAWFEGFGTLASQEPITKPEDFENLKLRIEGGISQEYYSKLGAKVEVVAFNEVYSALQTSRIDTVDSPIHQLYDTAFFEVLNYVTTPKHKGLHDLVVMNLDWYESLPADLQEVVTKAAEEAAPIAEKKLNEDTVKAQEEMEAEGIEFLDPSDELVDEMKQYDDELEELFISDNGEKGENILNNLKKAIEDLE